MVRIVQAGVRELGRTAIKNPNPDLVRTIRPTIRYSDPYIGLDRDIAYWCSKYNNVDDIYRKRQVFGGQIIYPAMNVKFIVFCRPVFQQLFEKICLEKICYSKLIFKENDESKTMEIDTANSISLKICPNTLKDFKYTISHFRHTVYELCRIRTLDVDLLNEIPLSVHGFFHMCDKLLDKLQSGDPKTTPTRVMDLAYFLFKHPVVYDQLDYYHFLEKIYHLKFMMLPEEWHRIFETGRVGYFKGELVAADNYSQSLKHRLFDIFEQWIEHLMIRGHRKCGKDKVKKAQYEKELREKYTKAQYLFTFLHNAKRHYQEVEKYCFSGVLSIVTEINLQVPSAVPLMFQLLFEECEGDGNLTCRRKEFLIRYLESMPEIMRPAVIKSETFFGEKGDNRIYAGSNTGRPYREAQDSDRSSDGKANTSLDRKAGLKSVQKFRKPSSKN